MYSCSVDSVYAIGDPILPGLLLNPQVVSRAYSLGKPCLRRFLAPIRVVICARQLLDLRR